MLSNCAKEWSAFEVTQGRAEVRLTARLHLASILLVWRRNTFGGHEWQSGGERVVACGHPTAGTDSTSARAVIEVALLGEAHALPPPCGENGVCERTKDGTVRERTICKEKTDSGAESKQGGDGRRNEIEDWPRCKVSGAESCRSSDCFGWSAHHKPCSFRAKCSLRIFIAIVNAWRGVLQLSLKMLYDLCSTLLCYSLALSLG